MQAFSVARDVAEGGDFFNFVVDPFNDHDNAVSFTTTPTGNRIDAQITNDAEGPTAVNYFWDAFWDVATTRDSLGWYVEMRIPFSSLRFDDNSGTVVMGLICNRLIGRKNERHVFPAIPPQWALGPFKPSRARDIVFEGVYPRRQLLVKPYMTARHHTTTAPRASGLRYERHGNLSADVGLDVKYAVLADLNLDVTVNTDFAETQADLQRVNLTRFSLFFPEQRQFFLERQGVFEFGITGFDRPFYSRRIGLSPTGEPVTILGGARLTGRVGGWDVGLLNMQTASGSDVLSSNLGVARIKHALVYGNSYVGGIITSRMDSDGNYNVLLGGDTELDLGDNFFLGVDGARTVDREPPVAGGALGPWSVRGRFERRSTIGLGFLADVSLIGADYRPELGFVERADAIGLGARGRWGVLNTGPALFRLLTPNVSTNLVLSHSRREVETFVVQGGLTMEAESGLLVTVSVDRTFERLADGFELPQDVDVPSGSYEFVRAEASMTPASGWPFGVGGRVAFGQFFDGTLLSFSVSPVWNVSSHLRIVGEYAFDQGRFGNRAMLFRSHLASVRATTAFNRRITADALLQLTTVEGWMTSQVRIRYNIREGNDLWLLYGQTLNTDRVRVRTQPRIQDTGLAIKYTHVFVR